MATSFQARYHTHCTLGGDSIEVGEWVVAHPDHGYVHEDCAFADDGASIPSEQAAERRNRTTPARTTMPRGKTARDKCPDCFMVHSAGQDGCE